MNKNIDPFEEEENLKNENEFLKIKLQLEQGAQFGAMETDDVLPANLENMFLRNIIEYEKQAADRKMIKVFDKIARPNHFKAVNEIPDDEIEKAWKDLDEYLHEYSIDLSVCSPNISKRELYRFTTEEFFNHEMDDMDLPGMMSGFIYDEFYPDHKYDNTRVAVDDCIGLIFTKKPIEWMPYMVGDNFRLNDHYPVSKENFKKIINRFKDVYEDIKANNIKAFDCSIDEKFCLVKGVYDITFILPLEETILKGNWQVEFELDKDLEYWNIVNVQIEKINL